MDQQRIDAFARVTLDPDPMHVDPDWAAQHSPYGTTVSFGFLTLSLLTYFCHQILDDRLLSMQSAGDSVPYGINYGFDRLRFVTPVPVGSRIRCHMSLTSCTEPRVGEMLHKLATVVEIEGRDRPALVADWLWLLVTPDGHERVRGALQV